MGGSRPLSDAHKETLSQWSRALGIAVASELFDREYRFREDSLELWIPVQRTLEPFLEKLKPGEVVTLFAAYVGAWVKRDHIDWVFIANEFEK